MPSPLRLGIMALGAAAGAGGVGNMAYRASVSAPEMNMPQLVSNAALPWYVALKVRNPGIGVELCGGVLVARNVVLTAAHCVASAVDSPANVRAFQGDGPLDALTAVLATRIATHPAWHEPGKVDAALVFLSQELAGGRPLKLRAVADVPAPADALLSGRGQMTNNVFAPSVGFAKLQVIEWQGCRGDWPELVTPSTICSIDTINGSCHGDSGGPLVMGTFQDAQLIGIVLGGPDLCGQKSRAGRFATVFTRSSAIADFVRRELPGLEVTTTAAPGPLFTPPKTNEI